MATNFKAECLRYLDRKGIKYTDRNDTTVSIRYNAENMKTIEVIVDFDEDGDPYVTFHSWSIGSFMEDSKYAKGLVVCNEMNKQYRWCKFYLDNDRDVTVQSDAIVSLDNVGPVVSELVQRIVGIMDKAYPEFMKAVWA